MSFVTTFLISTNLNKQTPNKFIRNSIQIYVFEFLTKRFITSHYYVCVNEDHKVAFAVSRLFYHQVLHIALLRLCERRSQGRFCRLSSVLSSSSSSLLLSASLSTPSRNRNRAGSVCVGLVRSMFHGDFHTGSVLCDPGSSFFSSIQRQYLNLFIDCHLRRTQIDYFESTHAFRISFTHRAISKRS